MTSRPAEAIHVLVYRLSDGRFMLAVKQQGWHRADRWSFRLARTHQIADPDPCPQGVTPAVWWAYSALRSLVTEQVRAHRDGPPV